MRASLCEGEGYEFESHRGYRWRIEDTRRLLKVSRALAKRNRSDPAGVRRSAPYPPRVVFKAKMVAARVCGTREASSTLAGHP